MKSKKGMVVAGTRSGCGKTTITMGIIGALAKAGHKVQPWKAGPDYIDPGFLTLAAGQSCRNLDSMILDERIIAELFYRRDSDISVVEGVMGLYDSAGPFDEKGSAAHLAKILGLPVILVIDGSAVARSAAATALGFVSFDKDVNIAGFIVNRVGSEYHYKILKDSIEAATGRPVLGYLPKDNQFVLPERHLGLDQDLSEQDQKETLNSVIEAIEESIDLDRLVKIAEETEAVETIDPYLFREEDRRKAKVRIAVARDEAFRFYYEDNLDLLRHHGAEIVFFSPLHDRTMGDGVDALYLGGGYPELYGEQLAGNQSLLEEIRALASQGMPIYGECGGFMYMTESIVDGSGNEYPMLGILPGRAVLGKKLRSLGYCTSRLNEDSIVGEKGTETKGHVFHWSALEGVNQGEKNVFSMSKGDSVYREGLRRGNSVGSWIHHHFASNPSMAVSFVKSALQFKKD